MIHRGGRMAVASFEMSLDFFPLDSMDDEEFEVFGE